MKGLIIIIAVCAFTAAMVPKERREDTTSTTQGHEVCLSRTPCAWSVYKPPTKMIEYNITNTYCICSSDTECKPDEDDVAVNAFIHHCLPPSTERPPE